MPLYEFRCIKCGHEDMEVREVEMRNEPKTCKNVTELLEVYGRDNLYVGQECNGQMKLKISRTSFTFKEK